MATQKKAGLLALLEILKIESDESHILTTEQLREKLQRAYDLDIERRTLYANIHALQDFGYEISDYGDNKKGYYLKQHAFDKEEVMLLCNSIHASHFISTEQSDRMIEKLLKTQSRYVADDYHDDVYLPNTGKTHSTQLMTNIATVSRAINERKKIRFAYMHYSMEKKLEPRKEHTVSPRSILYNDERPYMIAYDDSGEISGKFIHFRLDRMCNVIITNEKISSGTKIEDAYEYAKENPFMFAGEKIPVTLHCSASILDAMMDMFGTDAFVIPSRDKESFNLCVKAPKKTILILASQYMDSMEIKEPESLRRDMAQLLEEKLKLYKK